METLQLLQNHAGNKLLSLHRFNRTHLRTPQTLPVVKYRTLLGLGSTPAGLPAPPARHLFARVTHIQGKQGHYLRLVERVDGEPRELQIQTKYNIQKISRSMQFKPCILALVIKLAKFKFHKRLLLQSMRCTIY